MTPVEQPGVEKLEEQPAITRQRGEQHQRRLAAHDRVDGLPDVVWQRFGSRSDPCAITVIACHGDKTNAGATKCKACIRPASDRRPVDRNRGGRSWSPSTR